MMELLWTVIKKDFIVNTTLFVNAYLNKENDTTALFLCILYKIKLKKAMWLDLKLNFN